MLVIIVYIWLESCNCGVKEATHSSRNSSKGWWDICSTLAEIGIKDPREKAVDVAGPEKSSSEKGKENQQNRNYLTYQIYWEGIF